MKKTHKVGTISGTALMLQARGKLNRNDGIVKSGTGYHQDAKHYNRKGKKNQQLKNALKSYGSKVADFFMASYIDVDEKKLSYVHGLS